jgi:hypothetical protein
MTAMMEEKRVGNYSSKRSEKTPRIGDGKLEVVKMRFVSSV